MTVCHPEAVLHFWFERLGPEQRFVKDAAIDECIRREFFATWQAAAQGELSAWRERLSGRLAEIIVLDQFSRNLWRGDALSFAQDGMALALSQEAQKQAGFAALNQAEHQFLLMPMMHSESLAIQDASLPLFARFCDANTLDFAQRHRDIVAEFGRFPHRNAMLKRSNTAAEQAFLSQPNSSF